MERKVNYHSQIDVGLSLTCGRGRGGMGGRSHIIWTIVLVVPIRDEREGLGTSGSSKGPH